MGNVLEKIGRTYAKVLRFISVIRGRQDFDTHELRLKDILESITDGFFALDRNWVVRYYNKAAENMLLPREQIIDKNLWEVFPDAVGSLFYREYHKVMNEGVPAAFEEYYPGLNLWVQVNAYPSTGGGITIYFRDITENKRQVMLETLEKDVLEYYTGKGSSIESTIRLMLEGIGNIHPELLCSVLKVQNNTLKYFAFSQLPVPFIEATDNAVIKTGDGCLGMKTLSGEKTASLDIADDPEWEKYRDLAAAHGLKACVFYPLSDAWQKVIGLFTIYLNTPRALSPAEDATIEKAGYIIAHILRNHIAEETLKFSEEKYRDLFYLHPLPLWLYSIETYSFLDVNEAAIRDYGYSREEFLAMTIKDIRPAEDRDMLVKYISSAAFSGAYACGTFRHKKKSGELIYVEVRSNNVEFNGQKARLIISTDITAKVEMEMALNSSEKRFRAMVQEGSDLINILDMNGAYIYASPASAAMFGKQPEEVIGSQAIHYIHEDDREMIGALLAEISTSHRLQTPPYRFRLQNGQYRWLQSIGTNLLDDPAVNGIVVNSNDITDSIDHIHAIEEQNAKLRDIAWTQSHVVRGPLSRIMGLIELIGQNPDNQKLHSELIEHVLHSAHELDGIVRNIVRKTEQV